jgi:tetratricopeptide (TPR) repeat protein/glutathione synthase/RimK-type ligase-like ATP-grasp enzyme
MSGDRQHNNNHSNNATLDAPHLLLQAIEHHQAGKLDEAEAIYQQLLKRPQPMPEVFYLMSEIAIQRQQWTQAVELLTSAVDAAPTVCDYRIKLGRVLRKLGMLNDALACYRQALQLQPDHATCAIVHSDLANALFDMGRIDEAIATYRQAIALDSKFAAAYINLGNALKTQGQLDEAIACYRHALSIDANSALAHFNLALAMNERGLFDEAIASYQAAIRSKPDYVEAYCNLGVVFKEQNRLDDALACYEAALALDPNWVNALYNVGIICSLTKQHELAEQWYRRVLSIAPDFISARVNLANILHNDGRVDEAQIHRDYAYRRQCLFVIPSPTATRTVLILLESTDGNVPTQYLFPTKKNLLSASTTRLEWVIEYAHPEQFQQLPDYDLVFNAIGDADVTGRTDSAMTQFLSTCSKPVLNAPAAVSRTARHLLPQLFAGLEGVVVPPVWRVEQKGDWYANAEYSFPLIARPLVSHNGKGVVLAQDRTELAQVKIEQGNTIYLTAFRDYRSADGYFRKYRIIFIDRQPFPYHLAIADHWLVHYDTSDMTAAWKLEEEQRFLSDPKSVLGENAMNLIHEIGKRLDLDYCGVDFSMLPDGRLLIFEANATMLAHPEEEKEHLMFKNPYVQNIYAAFEKLLERR